MFGVASSSRPAGVVHRTRPRYPVAMHHSGRGHAGQIGVGAMAKDRRADSTAFLNAPALKELMGGAREASEEESLATREWALRDEPATREREAAEARNGHRHGAPSAEAAAPAAPASAPAEEQREPCGKILEPFSTAQEGMNKWKATMECPDAQKGVVAPDGAVVVPGDCPEALVSPAIKIHRPSAGWLPQPHHKSPTEIWEVICSEAKLESEREPALASFLYASILSHKSLERSMAFVLANKVASPTLLSVHLLKLFNEAYDSDPVLGECLRADMEAVRDRDPACQSYTQTMLFFKGFQAVQAYRITHQLWVQGRRSLAVALQNRISEIFHVDIHPAARVGRGILVDHATGVVIGETAVVGDNVSILHGVTLGGSGTGKGVRHPRIGHGVLLGAGVCVLGPVSVGDGAKIGAGSVVVTNIPDHSVAVGVPARVVRGPKPSQEPVADMDQTEGYILDFSI